MSKLLVAASLALAGLAATGLSAASYTAESVASLTLTDVTAGGTAASSGSFTIGHSFDGESDAFFFGTGAADSSFMSSGDVETSDGLELEAVASGSAGPSFGLGGSYADAFGDVILTNLLPGTAMSFVFKLTYSLSATAIAGVGADAVSFAGVEVFTDTSDIFDVEVVADALLGPELIEETDSYEFTVVVGGELSETVLIDAFAEGFAVATVPLPATAPLALAALGGLGLLSRRRKKSG